MTSLADFLKQQREDILGELRGCGEDTSELYKLLNKQDEDVTNGVCIFGFQEDKEDKHCLVINILSNDLNHVEKAIESNTEEWKRVKERMYKSDDIYVEFEEKSRGITAQITYWQQGQFGNKDYCDRAAELLDKVITETFEAPKEEAKSRELTQLDPDELYQKIVQIEFNIARGSYSENYEGVASLFDGDEKGKTQLALNVKKDFLDINKIKSFLIKLKDHKYEVSSTEDGFSIKITYPSMLQKEDIEAADKCVKDILSL